MLSYVTCFSPFSRAFPLHAHLRNICDASKRTGLAWNSAARLPTRRATVEGRALGCQLFTRGRKREREKNERTNVVQRKKDEKKIGQSGGPTKGDESRWTGAKDRREREWTQRSKRARRSPRVRPSQLPGRVISAKLPVIVRAHTHTHVSRCSRMCV